MLYVLEASIGGARTHLRQLVENLDRRRFAPAVACAARRDPYFQLDLSRFRARGVPVHDVPMRREIHPLADPIALVRLCRLIRRGRFGIVHTHSSKAGALGRVAAKLCSRAKIVHTPHTFAFTHDADFGPSRRSLFLLLERGLGRLTDRLIAVSSEEQALALRHRIAPPSRIALQFNGVACDAADRERGRKLLG
ncbi:MAG: glycosyltransferase, partial [Candidatus Binatia bacterium]